MPDSAAPGMSSPFEDRVKLALKFDPRRLQDDLSRLNEVPWIDHFVQQNYQGSWSAIPLRGPADAEHPIRMIYSDPGCRDFANTPFLNHCDYFREVLDTFRCPLQAVRLMKLTSGSRIKKHRDHDLSAEMGFARLHIPVTSNAKVDFQLNGRRVVLAEGECWYLRLSDLHSVENRGQEDRIHMVIDAEVNPWLYAMLRGKIPAAQNYHDSGT